jgi:DNA-binding transcriptional ArsR family regulator
MGSSEQPLSQDVVFDILSSPRRRYVLYYLKQVDEPIELTDLAEQVAAWENETTPDSLTDQERKRVYVSLYQTHIPKLDEAGIVTYDQDDGTVGLAPGSSAIDEYLPQSDEEFSWERLYITLAGLSTLLLIVAATTELLSGVVAAALVVGSFLVASGVHYLQYRRRQNEIPSELRRQQ